MDGAWLLLLPWLIPVLALALTGRRAAPGSWGLAAVPAGLSAGLAPDGVTLEIPWLLLGVSLGLDDPGRWVLGASALIWLAAGTHAALTLGRGPGARRFGVFFLLAMAGSLLLPLARDGLGFYLGFAVMGLAAYGLVVHDGSERARRAGRLYLGYTLVGELALLGALAILATRAGGLGFATLGEAAPPAAAVALLLLGLGIKLALPGLHLWLPPTYAAAPAPAAAVLSGPMITAGLLGWMRLLPPGAETLAGWGQGLVWVGLAGIALGTGLGLVQRDPRALLGYSSIAKMGLLAAGYGVAMSVPAAAPALIPALAWYAVHHLLLKGALFLGLDLARGPGRGAVMVGLVLLGLLLAGAPLGGLAWAKAGLAAALPSDRDALHLALWLASLGAALLMARLLWLLRAVPTTAPVGARPARLVFGLLCLVVLILPFALGQFSASWKALGPILTAAAVAAVAMSRGGRVRPGRDLRCSEGVVS